MKLHGLVRTGIGVLVVATAVWNLHNPDIDPWV